MVEVTTDESLLLLSQLRSMHEGHIPASVIDKLREQAAFEPHQELDYWVFIISFQLLPDSIFVTVFIPRFAASIK